MIMFILVTLLYLFAHTWERTHNIEHTHITFPHGSSQSTLACNFWYLVLIFISLKYLDPNVFVTFSFQIVKSSISLCIIFICNMYLMKYMIIYKNIIWLTQQSKPLISRHKQYHSNIHKRCPIFREYILD